MGSKIRIELVIFIIILNLFLKPVGNSHSWGTKLLYKIRWKTKMYGETLLYECVRGPLCFYSIFSCLGVKIPHRVLRYSEFIGGIFSCVGFFMKTSLLYIIICLFFMKTSFSSISRHSILVNMLGIRLDIQTLWN